MVKTYTNISSLMAGLQQELRSAMTEISLQGLMKAHENANEFYDQGNPEYYKRTGTYGTAPNTDGVKDLEMCKKWKSIWKKPDMDILLAHFCPRCLGCCRVSYCWSSR